MLQTHNVSNFHRAFSASIKLAGLSQSEVAARSGLAQSTVSRIMQGDFMPELDSLARLLMALEDQSDRLHCQQAYLQDHTLEEFRERLIITLGDVKEGKPRPVDAITSTLQALDRHAGENPALRRLLASLAEIMGESNGLHLEEETASYGTVDQLLDQHEAGAPGSDKAKKPAVKPRAGVVSSRPPRGSKR